MKMETLTEAAVCLFIGKLDLVLPETVSKWSSMWKLFISKMGDAHVFAFNLFYPTILLISGLERHAST